jgi:Uma2 family endonuclease
MLADIHPQRLAPTEYLDWEAQQSVKYEYINGEVYAMTGGTLPHNSIAVNLVSALKTHLRGKGCKVFMADAKVEISDQGPYFYPDLVVSCHPQDQKARKVIQYPTLIIEVLSPSTAGFDRGHKFKFYRRLKTLQEYILVDAETLSVECYRRNQQGKWELTAYPPDTDLPTEQETEVEFSSLNFRCPLALIYEDIELSEPSIRLISQPEAD